METSLYRVADDAPPRVHGRKVAPGDRMPLTEPEARYEVACGHLVAEEPEASGGGVDVVALLPAPESDA